MAQINKPSDYFNTKLYSGNSSTQSITGVGFQPDWTWIKYRNDGTYGHDLYDAVRGATKTLNTNNVLAEYTSADRLTSFDSDGFSLGSNASVNNSGGNYVAWNWLASNTTASNTSGSITSTVSANTTSGFSICTFTASGSGDQSFGHGLGATPKMVITKATSTTSGWNVYHVGTDTSAPEDDYLNLNLTNAKSDLPGVWGAGMTSSVAGIGVGVGVTSGVDYVAYCFAEKKGFSKFGSYTGNGSADGTFVYTGFKPAFVIRKNTDSTASWFLHDNKRDGYNVTKNWFSPNDSDAEETSLTLLSIDFLSNGFKMRSDNSNGNGSGTNYIYMAFAESPLVGTNNTPATAR